MFVLGFDFSELLNFKDFQSDLEAAAEKGGEELTKAIHAKIVELANQELHSRRDQYISAVKSTKTDDGEWEITLDKSAEWIETGKPSGNMIAAMLKSKKAKHGKNGKYITIPFNHTEGNQMSDKQLSLWTSIKGALSEFKTAGSNMGPKDTIRNKAGQPKTGHVGSFDLRSPINTGNPKLGSGPKGSVAQGHSGIPLLQGVRVYQQKVKSDSGPGKKAPSQSQGGKTTKSYMTFRTINENTKPPAWDYDKVEPTPIFKKAEDWADQEFTKAVDKIYDKLK